MFPSILSNVFIFFLLVFISLTIPISIHIPISIQLLRCGASGIGLQPLLRIPKLFGIFAVTLANFFILLHVAVDLVFDNRPDHEAFSHWENFLAGVEVVQHGQRQPPNIRRGHQLEYGLVVTIEQYMIHFLHNKPL